MAPVTSVIYTATTGQREYDLTFLYITASDLIVEIDGVVENDWTMLDADTVQLSVAVGATILGGEEVRISRSTNIDDQLVTFSSPSSIRASEIDQQIKQVLYYEQEIETDLTRAMSKNFAETSWDAQSLPIKNVAAPDDTTDAVNLAYVTSALAASGVLPEIAGTDVDKVLRVVDGPAYALRNHGEAIVEFEVPTQSNTLGAGQSEAYILDKGTAFTFTATSTRIPWALTNVIGNFLGDPITLDANTFDIVLPVGKWDIQVSGVLRSFGPFTSADAKIRADIALTTEIGSSTGYDFQKYIDLGTSGSTTQVTQSVGFRLRELLNVSSGTQSINLRAIAQSGTDCNVLLNRRCRLTIKQVLA